MEIVTEKLGTVLVPISRTVGDLSPEELTAYISNPQGDWEQTLIQLAHLNPTDEVNISAESLRRENLYEDRGF